VELLNQMRDAADGLDALNAKHVQHRDVKPLSRSFPGGRPLGPRRRLRRLKVPPRRNGCNDFP
jgi:hypothetical protein